MLIQSKMAEKLEEKIPCTWYEMLLSGENPHLENNPKFLKCVGCIGYKEGCTDYMPSAKEKKK